MMVGIPPFYHSNQNIMFQLITECDVKFPSQINISEDAKDLIIKVILLSYYSHLMILAFGKEP